MASPAIGVAMTMAVEMVIPVMNHVRAIIYLDFITHLEAAGYDLDRPV
jgi:hypothetical protein